MDSVWFLTKNSLMKVLIIRFSSIGDVTQALSIPTAIRTKFPDAEIHFLTKNPFQQLIESHPYVKQTWTYTKNSSSQSFFELIKQLKNEKFDAIYDAHNNLRSNLFTLFLRSPLKLKKSHERFKRFLLIQFKINRFEKPFSGQADLLRPLTQWGIDLKIPEGEQLFLPQDAFNKMELLKKSYSIPENYTILAPSAAHPFKRWPLEKWKDLIELNPNKQFIILAGPDDSFTEKLNVFKNVINLTGQTTLLESAAFIAKSHGVVSNDTGLLHFAEQLNKKAIAIMGAAPFGFPSKKQTIILHQPPSCWPCSKHGQGPCTNKIFFECMNSISALEVNEELKKIC